MLRKEWFEEKRCLDIGCHTGDMTIMCTLLYKPEIMIGVDINHKLIAKAIKSMHKIANEHSVT